MTTDICFCGHLREAHLQGDTALAAALKGEIVCAAFRLDRKATWHAERGQKAKRIVTVLKGCRACGNSSNVTYHKDAQGYLRHTACLGPQAAAR